MLRILLAVGASLILVASMGAADAKNDRQNPDTGAVPPTWTGTSPPGFSKGKKAWRNSSPPGWTNTHAKRRGWNGQSMPPGLYKKTLTQPTTPAPSR